MVKWLQVSSHFKLVTLPPGDGWYTCVSAKAGKDTHLSFVRVNVTDYGQ